MSDAAFRRDCDVLKVDDELGLVFGWAVICKEAGQDYYDTQGDHVEEEAMLNAAADFAQKSRVAGDMHRVEDGTAVFLFPMTTEVAKAFEMTTPRTGLLIAVKPSKEVLEKFKNGTYTGFSIGGTRQEEEVVED